MEDALLRTLVIGAIGMSIFLFGIYLRYRHNRKKRLCTVQVTGCVADVRREVSHNTGDDKGGRSGGLYYPAFAYSVDDRTIEKTSGTGTGWRRFKKVMPLRSSTIPITLSNAMSSRIRLTTSPTLSLCSLAY